MSSIRQELPLEPSRPKGRRIDDYRLMSTPVAIRSVDVELADALRWHLDPFFVGRPQRASFDVRIEATEEDRRSRRRTFTYTRGGEPLFRGSAHRVLKWALWDLHSLVHRDGRDFLYLHAGAVERQGRRIIVPGGPDAGKSTLVASLLSRGFGYLSDECAAIDPVTDRVYPFPKQIAISERALPYLVGGAPELPDDYPPLTTKLVDRFLRPQDLGSAVATPGPVDLIVFLARDRDGDPTLRPMSSAGSLARLHDHALNDHVFGDRAIRMLARIVRSAEVLDLTGGSTQAWAALLDRHIRRTTS